jgi:O-methyltransferase involved in polyketide biosynthesis
MLLTRASPRLSGVPETMLWALHDRAREAMRPDGALRDPECVRIYSAIEYDFIGRFGAPTGRAAARAVKIDRTLRRWLTLHPRGFIVSLGEGLETQAYRVDNGAMTWLSVDLPDAIQFREYFIKPEARFRHLAMSAFDPEWMDHVDDRSGVFIVAQGLFMYFAPEAVRELLMTIAKRFPGAEMAFDVLPKEATKQHRQITPIWTSPAMRWGIDRDEVRATLRLWLPGLKAISSSRYRWADRRPAIVENLLDAVLPHRQRLPSLVHVRF